jgi:hypothetical protein
MRGHLSARWVLPLLACALPGPASAQVRIGSEFPVNTYTTSTQHKPAIAIGPSGEFVVAWRGIGAPGSGYDIFARRFDIDGRPSGPEVLVNTWTPGGQDNPAVVSSGNGEFVVLWSGEEWEDGSGVFGRVMNSAGNAVGSVFQVNAYATGVQTDPAAVVDSDGNMLVVWSGAGAGDFDGVFGRRLTSHGLPLGGEFMVNTSVPANQRHPAIARDAADDFLVVWTTGHDNGLDDVAGQRLDSVGAKVGQEFPINGYVTNDQDRPVVASDATGDCFLAWNSLGQDGSLSGVYARRFLLPNLAYVGTEFRVNTYTYSNQLDPSVAVDGAEQFVVVWTGSAQDGSGTGVFGQRYNASFQTLGSEFQVNTFTTQDQKEAVIASDADGYWVAAWSSGGNQDGSGQGVFAQRFGPDRIFDDSFDTGSLAAWSAVNTDGGDLSVTAAAALQGPRGLQAVVDDTAGLWVQDSRPRHEDRYRARFYFDPNGFDPGEALNHRRVILFVAFEESAMRRLAIVVLRRLSGAYAVGARVRLDDGTRSDSPFFPISDAPHFVELEWKRSSGPDAEDGAFSLWLDGSLVHTASDLDNSLSAVDLARIGAISVKVGAAGTLYLDAFRSRRESYIGQ